MSVFLSRPYDEHRYHLALGIEPRSSLTGSRLDAGLEVRWERYPKPVGRWRTWRPGETLTDVLPRIDRHSSGRFARRYDEEVARPMLVRLVDRQRRYVPRRLEIPIPDEATVVGAVGPHLVPDPAWRRSFPVDLFPGAAAPLTSGATVLRGHVVRQVGGVPQPVRWARVRAVTPTGAEIGWAHGDDRGEFVLVLRPARGALTVPVDPMVVELTVSRPDPPPVPPASDPDLARVDPLWDLPLETVVPSRTPATEATLTGRRFIPTFLDRAPLSPAGPLSLRHGRQTSVVLTIA
ncbi:hypothetical protein GCM10022237_08110 [Nocardioides ginsengisoli]|uniref:Carboxypeptidase regulatory-like domain-containing protein n=1 Tax=Nocardioides ginsengisoli TaxID=363868 RepID=A0ABW3W0R3_9ACTN